MRFQAIGTLIRLKLSVYSYDSEFLQFPEQTTWITKYSLDLNPRSRIVDLRVECHFGSLGAQKEFSK